MVWNLLENAFNGDDDLPPAWRGKAKGLRAHAEDARAFVRASVGGELQESICFMHLPKCAGMTVDSAIRRQFRSLWTNEGAGIRNLHPGSADDVGGMYDVSNWHVRASVLAYYLARPETRYVSGHVPVTSEILEHFSERFAFVTLTRHPVDRWISHYLYNTYTPEDHTYHIDMPMEAFLETERARDIGQIFLSYLTGTGDMAPGARAESERVLEQAKDNLDRFDVVGFVEDIPGFVSSFAERFEVELNLLRRNTNPATEDEKNVDAETRAKIRDVCAPDLELYEYARRRFGR